jgi:hypothetical protein
MFSINLLILSKEELLWVKCLDKSFVVEQGAASWQSKLVDPLHLLQNERLTPPD